MKRVIFLLLTMAAVAGCGLTPNQLYTLQAGAYDGASVGLTVAHNEGKITAAQWPQIQNDLATAKADLMAAQAWLQAHPTLANVPGAGAGTPVDPMVSAVSILVGYVGQFDLVPVTPPATAPTSQPAE